MIKSIIKSILTLIILIFTSLTFAQNKDTELLNKVLNTLQIAESNYFPKLVDIYYVETNSDEVIIFIPEISEKTEHYTAFRVHLLIVNGESGNIKSSFSEDNWLYNDAIGIDSVEILYNDIEIGANRNVIILKIIQSNNSRIFPYYGEYLSIFSTSDDSLKLLLQDYMIKSFNGETNMGCEGEFIEHKRNIKSIFNEKSRYYDLKVIDSITTTVTNKDCEDESVKKEQLQEILVFNGEQYVKKGKE